MDSQINDELLDDHLESFVRDSPPGVLLMPFEHDNDALLRQSPDYPMDDMIGDSRGSSSYGRGRGTSAPTNIPDKLFIIGSLPSEYSESPNKRVQFEVGGGDDEDQVGYRPDNKTMSQPNVLNNSTPNNTNSNETTNNTTPSRNRADSRDYLVQPGSAIALLPAIAEERFGRAPPYLGRSISILEHGMRHGNLDGDKEIYGFVQLDILTGAGDGLDMGQRDWKETARWIKYEEDLEEGADRWGRPHIASLSFHSLIKLRKLIERDGVIMLDIEEKDMPGVAYRIVEELSGKGLIKTEESPLLMRALLLKHKHVQEQEASWFKLRRSNTSSASALNSMLDEKNRNRSMIDPSNLVRRNSVSKTITEFTASSRSLQRTSSGNYLRPAGADHVSVEVKPVPISEMYCPSEEDLKWIQGKENMIKRLPPGAEATMVMVGDFEGLKKPIFVFLRLKEAAYMFNVTEVPVPARFFSILLVPTNMELDLLEIGRAFGALMSNRQFYEVALGATGRKNLLSGINEFLDDSIVLPPGDWDNEDLLPLHVLQTKTTKIKKRRLKKQMSFVMSNDSFCENGSVMGLGTIPEICDTKDKKDLPNPFKRTGRPFGGMWMELTRRLPYYKSDILDGLNFQCLATIIFMYCASIAQVITFAGLMGEKTNNLIGMSETLTSTAGAGIFFALFSGQPLIPIGPTGPLLVFDEILFGFCGRHNIDFLTTRVWISIWLFIFSTVLVCVEGSVLVKWCTRFTQDVFAVLTSVLLMYECVDNLIEVYVHHPLGYDSLDTRPISLTINTTHYSIVYEETTPAPIMDESEDLRRQPNTALLCTILVLGTFFIAYFLREFRNSVFLGERARRALGDFGVPIAVITMVFLDYSATDTYTQKMKVPVGLEPSNPEERGWVISPLGRDGSFNLLIALGSALPAMLVFILIFMTTQICELIVNKKERKLVKGSGYHLDIFLIALINLGAGFMGAPWLCCATLRGLAHVTALTVYSENNPPGEKPTIVAVREQRVTCFSVAFLIGCSVLLAPVLKFIPLAVLFGVFLYMGVSSLSSTQLYDRFRLLFIPVSSHPQTIYVRRVRTWKMHLYTLIQLGCLAMLWGVKSVKEAALAFPFVLMFLVPIRLQLKHLYNESELEALDGDL